MSIQRTVYMFKKTLLPVFALVIAAVFGGLNGVFAKLVLRSFSPFAFSTIRYIAVFSILIPILVIQKKLNVKNKDFLLFLFISLLWAGNQFFFLFAVQYTTAIMSQVMYFLSPFIVAFLSIILYKQKLSISQIFGIILGLIGGVIVILKSYSDNSLITLQSLGSFRGNILLILAVISWSLYLIFSKKVLKNYSALTLTAYSGIMPFLIGSVFFIPEIKAGIFSPPLIRSESIIGLLGLIFGGSIMMVFLYQWGIKRTSPFIASSMIYISPISAAIAAIPIFGEHITIELLLSFAIVALSVYFVTIHPFINNINRLK